VEYLHEHPRAKAKTLFATHYHELNEMENTFRRVKNYNVSIKELGNKVIFLRKLVRGGSNHSFGIHVAADGRDAQECGAAGRGDSEAAGEYPPEGESGQAFGDHWHKEGGPSAQLLSVG
jgi:hypothetical protein